MNEKIWKVLDHRATKATCFSVLGFTAGAMFGHWRTKSRYETILDAKVDEIWEKSKVETSNQLEIPFELGAVIGEFNKAVMQASLVTREMSSAGTDMLEGFRKLTEFGMKMVEVDRDDIAAEALKEDHPAPKRRPLQSVRDIKSARIESVSVTPQDETEHGGGRITSVEPVMSNVFDTAGDEWDYKTELESRTDQAPYIIHVDEYTSDESGWDSQSTLTWYEGDQILTDEHDTPIYNPDEIVGELRFGHGSQDPNTLYVRNPKLKAEYEILRDEGSYQEIVLGEKLEEQGRRADLKHSHQRRFRAD